MIKPSVGEKQKTINIDPNGENFETHVHHHSLRSGGDPAWTTDSQGPREFAWMIDIDTYDGSDGHTSLQEIQAAIDSPDKTYDHNKIANLVTNMEEALGRMKADPRGEAEAAAASVALQPLRDLRSVARAAGGVALAAATIVVGAFASLFVEPWK